VKILDFGLARFACDALSATPSGAATGCQRPSPVTGTPGYIAPEQARAPQEADTYSLGCTLFYLLTDFTARAGSQQTLSVWKRDKQ
jgi:serine/threonine protein kinase